MLIKLTTDIIIFLFIALLLQQSTFHPRIWPAVIAHYYLLYINDILPDRIVTEFVLHRYKYIIKFVCIHAALTCRICECDFFWLRSIFVVACPNQQSGSNPTRARFVLNRVELSFFPLYFYDYKYIRSKQLLSAENFVHYITRNKFTQASKEQPQTCWVFLT